MARIPEREVERVKSEVSLARLVESHGVVLTRDGADLLGRCPFHDDHEPSLVISPKKNLWHCLGACQTGGSVIDWVMRLEGVSFRHAVVLLREGIPSLAAETTSPPRVVKQSTVPKLPVPVASEVNDHALIGQVIDYYHATFARFRKSTEAGEVIGDTWFRAEIRNVLARRVERDGHGGDRRSVKFRERAHDQVL